MRVLIFLATIILLIAGSAWSVSYYDRYVVPIKNNIEVFAHNPKITDERPVSVAGTGQWLMVLDSKGDMLKVTDMKGNIGWIDKASVERTKLGETMIFAGADVLGYMDNPTPIIILDATNPVGNSIMLDRSFSNELKENIDRMTIDRIVGANTEQW